MHLPVSALAGGGGARMLDVIQCCLLAVVPGLVPKHIWSGEPLPTAASGFFLHQRHLTSASLALIGGTCCSSAALAASL